MIRLRVTLAVCVCLCVVVHIVGKATKSEERAPAGRKPRSSSGLAMHYPGDAGIARDPAVLFAEDFEANGLAEIGKHWDSISNEDGKVLALSKEVPPDSSGKHSLEITATAGENAGGHLYKRLPRAVELVYARFYVRFPTMAQYIHHFVHLGGYYPSTPYPQGGAGIRPQGNDRFTVGIEPYGVHGRFRAPGIWNFYAYWPEMKVSGDGKYWGNSLRPARPALAPRGRWQCVEVMLQCNTTPQNADGALALWLDGRQIARFEAGAPRGRWTGEGFELLERGGEPFEGFRWRTTNDLKINYFWLLHYVTEHAARRDRDPNPSRLNRVWFDDIVIATKYVGPMER